MIILTCYSLISVLTTPVEIINHVQDARVITDDVHVAIVDQSLVVLKTELNIISAIIHEHVDHGEVDITRVGELRVTHMQSLSGGVPVTEVFIVVLSWVKVTESDVVVVVTTHVSQHCSKLVVPAQPGIITK